MVTAAAPDRTARRGRWLVALSLLGAVGAVGAVAAAAAVVNRGADPAVAGPGPTEAAPSPAVTLPPVAPVSWAPAVAAARPAPGDLLGEDPVELLQAAATQLLDHAPLVVLGPLTDPAAAGAARAIAEELAAPLLLGPAAASGRPVPDLGEQAAAISLANAEVVRGLAPRALIVVGDVAPPGLGVRTHRVATDGVAQDPVLGRLRAAAAAAEPEDVAGTGDVALVRAGDVSGVLAAVTARAAGVRVVTLNDDDPRGDPAARAALAGHPGGFWALGAEATWAAVDRSRLGWQLEVARRGAELPGGGQLLFPRRRFVALYGNPSGGALGLLGEQPAEAAVARAREVAAAYAEHSAVPVVPAFEIIATIASAGPGPNGDYSRRTDRAELEHWVDVAEAAGVYVVLDLQPGRTDFLTQAREYEDLLARPHVGLALDPEWRLGPSQVHLRQIGSVGIEEVNAVVTWLADLTRREALPQKLLILHQFKLSMIRDRALLDTSRPELAVLIHADGQGSQPAKLETYRALTTLDPPTGVWWGWKNFHDEDTTLRSPADTLAVRPEPFFVSYQ